MDFSLLKIFSPSNILMFIAVFVRIGGLMASAPLYSTYPVPNRIKIFLVAFIAFIIYPMVQANSAFPVPNDIPVYLFILIKEFAIGYIIGFCANLIFIGAEIGVNMFSIQMGLAMSQAFNPTIGATSPIITQAFTLLIAMVFISLNAHQWLFSALYNSFIHIPVGYSFIFDRQLIEKVIYLSGQMFSIAIGLAMPIFSVLLISDILLGFVSKLMPQMNIFMVGMPIRIYAGLILCMIFMRPVAEYCRIILEKLLINVSGIF